MKIKFNFNLYPDYDNKHDKHSVFKIDNPKIEIDIENFKKTINIFFDKSIHNKEHLFVEFKKHNDKVFFDIFIDLYNENDKEKINEKIEDLILDTINILGIELYRRHDITDEIDTIFEFNNAIFYNTYKYCYKKSKKTNQIFHWLKLTKSIGEVNGKLTRYNKFIKK